MDNPTGRQCAAAKRVQEQVMSEIELLAGEGIGPHETVAGLGAALAQVIATAWGTDQVARWFTAQGSLLAGIGESKH